MDKYELTKLFWENSQRFTDAHFRANLILRFFNTSRHEIMLLLTPDYKYDFVQLIYGTSTSASIGVVLYDCFQ